MHFLVAKLLKMLSEYMDLTVLPFFETWSAHIFGGWQRVCWCTNEASKNFEKTALRKRVGILTVKMRGWHIYGNYCIRNNRRIHVRKIFNPTQSWLLDFIFLLVPVLTSLSLDSLWCCLASPHPCCLIWWWPVLKTVIIPLLIMTHLVWPKSIA